MRHLVTLFIESLSCFAHRAILLAGSHACAHFLCHTRMDKYFIPGIKQKCMKMKSVLFLMPNRTTQQNCEYCLKKLIFNFGYWCL